MEIKRKPSWLRVNLKEATEMKHVENLINTYSLNTVCKEANCPNRFECYSKKTATFMILGNICTRNCRFCNILGGIPGKVNIDEPKEVAKAVIDLGLKHAVITSVTRDDLPDGGANQFAKVIREIKRRDENIIVEVLIPDLLGNINSLKTVLDAKPDILNHNIETVKRLYLDVRPGAIYERSLELLERVKEIDPLIMTKSGIMVGLGELKEEVFEVIKDLRKIKCDFLTIGQYLQPTKKHYQIKEYIHPYVFDEYKEEALRQGFVFVASAPLVRSSYNAAQFYKAFNKLRTLKV